MKNVIEHKQQFFSILFLTIICLIITFSFSFSANFNFFQKGNNRTQTNIINCPPTSENNFESNIEEVTINDNRSPAGEFRKGIYFIA